jgi:hypothetical protein
MSRRNEYMKNNLILTSSYPPLKSYGSNRLSSGVVFVLLSTCISVSDKSTFPSLLHTRDAAG